ncbi:MAG: hypothetical protein GKR89_04970 [Candidatus Latescibacteria bacterium]|nr:hypothetical protein [Candidatus Latescibacterota bacterium]
MSAPIALGPRRELFVDQFLLDQLDNAALHLHPPVRREIVYQVSQPWDNACTGCYNFTQDGDRILMYYRDFYPIGEQFADAAANQTTNLAISRDGIHFDHPDLGLVEFNGTRKNNVLIQGHESHNFCVFLDANPAADPAQRFKAVGGTGKANLHGFASPDGLNWTPVVEGPLEVTGAFDSVNVALWDPHIERYRLFSRYFDTEGDRVRAIQSCTSEDFIHWSQPEPHLYADDIPLEHFYTNATLACPGAEHILLSFPMRFLPERQLDIAAMDYPGQGLSDAIFMSSRDGVHWDRTFMEAWLRPGTDQRNWSHRSCTPAPGLVQTGDEWSMYISENYGWSTNRLRRVTVRPHGFASVRAGYKGGQLRTRPLLLEGSSLRLNYATSAAGSLRVEIQDEAGQPLPNYALEDMEPIYGDQLDAAVAWKSGGDLSALRGSPVRLRVVLQDADLFALRTC